MPKLIDIKKQKFGRVTVIKRFDLHHGSARWFCRCECGTFLVVSGGSLRSGHTKSCGCLNREISSVVNTKHGKASSSNRKSARCYSSWNNMIQICDRWHEFANFYADMGDCPENHTLDRIDNNGNYELSNCRWATRKTQSNNMRSNIIIDYLGTQLTISQWSKKIGVNRSTIDARIRRGWQIVNALYGKYEPGTDAEEYKLPLFNLHD